MKKTILLAVFVISLPVKAGAQSAKEVNEANNPLTPKITINLQDYYTDSYYGLHDTKSNTGWVFSLWVNAYVLPRESILVM